MFHEYRGEFAQQLIVRPHVVYMYICASILTQLVFSSQL